MAAVTLAAILCLHLTAICGDLAPECTSARPRDRFEACRPVRECIQTRYRVCELAEQQEREREAAMVRQANRERSEGR